MTRRAVMRAMMRDRSWMSAVLAACLSGIVFAAVPAATAADLPGRRAQTPLHAVPLASAPVTDEEPGATGTLTAETEESGTAEAPAVEGGDAPAVAPESTTPPIPEFLRRSGSRAGGPANELNTGDARARERPPGGSVSQMLSGRDLYHGNYCGPGDRGAGVAPTDALDAICQRHDACYGQAGRRSCGCDRALRVSALEAAASKSLSREVRARAASVAESVAFMNCVEP